MRFQILLIQEKSVNMAGTEPCKCYLFLHDSHVYMASDSISEKILASVPRFLAKFRPFFDGKLFIEFSDIQRSMTVFNIFPTFYDTYHIFCVQWMFTFGGYIKVLWFFSTFSPEFPGLPGNLPEKIIRKKFWICPNLPIWTSIMLKVLILTESHLIHECAKIRLLWKAFFQC